MHGMHMHHHSDEESEIGFYDKALMSRLMKFMAPHRNTFLLALCLMLTQVVFTVVRPYLQKVAIDDYIMKPDEPGSVKGLTIIVLLMLGI